MTDMTGWAEARRRIAEVAASGRTLLRLSRLDLRELPPELFELTRLRALFVHGNPLRAVPEDLARLRSLTLLDLAATEIDDLTPVTGLPLLEMLGVEDTKVSDLSPLRQLKSLRGLSCDGTGVSDLEPLPLLSADGRLWANRCTFRTAPVQHVRNPRMTFLALWQTAVPGWPAEILSRDYQENCLDRVRAHLDDLDDGAAPVQTTKVIVLGNGRVGKTQLCRRLQGQDFDSTVRSTHGITIARTTLGDETISLWDFGGQDLYHGAHAMFMRTRAVFIIAWHPDWERTREHTHEGQTFRNEPLGYWVELVRTMGGPEVPIIIVQSQCERGADEQSIAARVTTTGFVQSVAYSARTERKAGTLRDALTAAIEHLREREGERFIGAGRARVIRQLEQWRTEDGLRPPAERQHRVLDYAAFEALCEEIGGVSSPSALLDYLHHTGLVFHDPKRFGDRILLDQAWAFEAVYALFDRHYTWRQLQGTDGRFTRAMLALSVWRDYAESDQRLFLELMTTCGICFVCKEVADEEPEYLAPDLLPEEQKVAEQMAGRWDDDAPTRVLVYDYAFQHPGSFRGLLSDIGRRGADAGVYWKSGLWLYERESRAKVRLTSEARGEHGGRLTLALQGGASPDLELWLRERIAHQHQLYGHTELQPTQDDLAIERRDRIEREPPKQPPEPTFEPLPATSFPRPPCPQVFISYAWNHGTTDGGQDIAHALEPALTRAGADVQIDKTNVSPGARISNFIDRLIGGNVVVLVLSERYLRSEHCMHELLGIWQRSRSNPREFLGRVIPVVLPNANIDSFEGRMQHAIHWKDVHRQREASYAANRELFGPADTAEYKRIVEFYLHTTEILRHLSDSLMPRTLAELQADDYAVIKNVFRLASAPDV